MRLLGSLLVIGSAALLGMLRAEAGRRRLRLLEALSAALRCLEGELCGSLRPVRESLRLTAERSDAAAAFFRACLEQPDDALLGEGWAEAALSLRELTEEERRVLSGLGAVVGRREAERQSEALLRAAERFGSAAEAVRENAGREYRLRAALGLGAGVVLAILAA